MATTKTRFATVKDYLAAQPKERRVVLERVRKAIRRAVPGGEECIAYQIPAYALNGVTVLYYAGWKEHYSLYPMSDALVEKFKRELAPYGRSKGTLKLPLSEPVPVELIERIAKFRADQLTIRTTGKRGRKGGPQGQLDRIRRMCATLPRVFEKMSHGTPTFFVEEGKGVFAMFADHHHDDGRLALWVPVADGLQPLLIEEAPHLYFKPPYVGASGWVGILLDQVPDDALQAHLREAWHLVTGRQKKGRASRRG